ncbi:MAG TPA: undecaprenyl-diphosphate phosphatase [Chloroflexota bacterium]
MDELVKATVLGVVEGITEFLPISSTGHLLVAANLLRFGGSAGGTFEIFIQFGAVIALLAFYARDLLGQAAAFPRDGRVRRFWLCVLLAFLPAALVGLLLRGWIKTVLFASPGLIAGSFILGGIVLIAVELLPQRKVTTLEAEAVTVGQAFLIGLAQMLALVPGVSRSGASIVGGMLTGLDRAAATRFSFYLAIPTLGAATLLELATSLRRLESGDALLLLVGTVVSTVVAFLSIGWLLRYVQHNSFVPFGVYRIAAGLIVLALIQIGVI